MARVTWSALGRSSRPRRRPRRFARKPSRNCCRAPCCSTSVVPTRPSPMRCDRYELRDDPAAPGEWRGGIGIVRKNRFLEPGVYSCEGDPPHRPAAWHLRRLRRPAGQVHVHRQGRQGARHPGQGDRVPVRRRRDHPAHRAELGRVRQPARPRAAARARGRARRLHDDQAGARGLRRRDLEAPEDRRGGHRRTCARRCGARRARSSRASC